MGAFSYCSTPFVLRFLTSELDNLLYLQSVNLHILLFVFETGCRVAQTGPDRHSVADDGVELLILLPLPLK